eukprot:CAMPEP_0198289974 /NCGR_PEP_ID=MMETSP1449-20131203/7982_1 /TAXON_ID=420275 /ORGANISM="Attheya septentrionalis, Strain CCMP2084" /LENGTH=207 /DNA_ID=CAMNT_0043988381 /DNA_START=192 /DNA_END=815 /DNA_ORIENTATION=-
MVRRDGHTNAAIESRTIFHSNGIARSSSTHNHHNSATVPAFVECNHRTIMESANFPYDECYPIQITRNKTHIEEQRQETNFPFDETPISIRDNVDRRRRSETIIETPNNCHRDMWKEDRVNHNRQRKLEMKRESHSWEMELEQFKNSLPPPCPIVSFDSSCSSAVPCLVNDSVDESSIISTLSEEEEKRIHMFREEEEIPFDEVWNP